MQNSYRFHLWERRLIFSKSQPCVLLTHWLYLLIARGPHRLHCCVCVKKKITITKTFFQFALPIFFSLSSDPVKTRYVEKYRSANPSHCYKLDLHVSRWWQKYRRITIKALLEWGNIYMAMHEQIYIHFVCLKVIHKKKKRRHFGWWYLT